MDRHTRVAYAASRSHAPRGSCRQAGSCLADGPDARIDIPREDSRAGPWTVSRSSSIFSPAAIACETTRDCRLSQRTSCSIDFLQAIPRREAARPFESPSHIARTDADQRHDRMIGTVREAQDHVRCFSTMHAPLLPPPVPLTSAPSCDRNIRSALEPATQVINPAELSIGGRRGVRAHAMQECELALPSATTPMDCRLLRSSRRWRSASADTAHRWSSGLFTKSGEAILMAGKAELFDDEDVLA